MLLWYVKVTIHRVALDPTMPTADLGISLMPRARFEA